MRSDKQTLPAEAYQLAQTYQLGEPKKLYRQRDAGWSFFISGMTFFFLGLFLLSLLILAIVHPGTIQIFNIGVAVLIGILIVFFLLIGALLTLFGLSYFPYRAYEFEDGFIELHRSRVLHVVHWHDIIRVLEQKQRSSTTYTLINSAGDKIKLPYKELRLRCQREVAS